MQTIPTTRSRFLPRNSLSCKDVNSGALSSRWRRPMHIPKPPLPVTRYKAPTLEVLHVPPTPLPTHRHSLRRLYVVALRPGTQVCPRTLQLERTRARALHGHGPSILRRHDRNRRPEHDVGIVRRRSQHRATRGVVAGRHGSRRMGADFKRPLPRWQFERSIHNGCTGIRPTEDLPNGNTVDGRSDSDPSTTIGLSTSAMRGAA